VGLVGLPSSKSAVNIRQKIFNSSHEYKIGPVLISALVLAVAYRPEG
jgi:hypothetical protein